MTETPNKGFGTRLTEKELMEAQHLHDTLSDLCHNLPMYIIGPAISYLHAEMLVANCDAAHPLEHALEELTHTVADLKRGMLLIVGRKEESDKVTVPKIVWNE